MDTRKLIDTREARYGSMDANATETWRLMDVFERCPGWSRFTPVQKHVFYMTVHKMARMLCGDPNYIDNYDDIIGYWTRARDFLPLEEEDDPGVVRVQGGYDETSPKYVSVSNRQARFELPPDESWK